MTEDTHTQADSHSEENGSSWMGGDMTAAVATAGVIVVGAALIEVALIPGMIVGAAAVLAPKYAPKVVSSVQPMFRSAVRGVYKMGRKAKEAVADAREHVNDIVAEVHAEDIPAGAPNPKGPSSV